VAQVRSASLIFNPDSGPGDPEEDLRRIVEAFHARAVRVKVFETADAPAQAAEKALAEAPEIVLAAGGDGTIGSVAGVMAGKDVPLGVLPSGTANALAIALGIPRDLEKACELIFTGTPRTIDLARCNGNIISLLVAIGFEARLVKEIDKDAKEKWGPLAYYIEGLAQLPNRELFETEIQADENRLTLKAAAVTVANAAPPSSPLAQGLGEVVVDDGKLDVTVAGPETFMQTVETLAELVRAIATRRPVEADFLKAVRAGRVIVNAYPPQPVVGDGEDLGTTPIEVVCLPRALRVIAPA
jgi:YegS/Rv2252/BmrU family lipid kinase